MARRRWATLALVFALAVLLGPWFVRALLGARSGNSIRRGERLAARAGCLGCHRAPLRQDVANPGSRFGSIPSFDGGELMMYAANREQVRAWIAAGGPAEHWADEANRAAREVQTIRMPAFGARLSSSEIDDLTDYMLAVNAAMTPEGEPERRGEEVARAHCLGCHGPGGAGGGANPGSIAGYVPALWGPDFEDLVRGPGEFREWVRTGRVQRLARWAAVRWVWDRQTVRMPAYGDRLSDSSVEDLHAYVRWLDRTAGGTRPESERGTR